MIYLISTLEIALFILFPLIKFFQYGKCPKRQYILIIALLYFIWFFTYAGLHEVSHLFGSWIMDTKINGYQLIPPFWKGDFKTAYVNSIFENNNQAVVSIIMPYLRDIVFLLIGFWILRRKRINSLFLGGLFLLLFVLSPIFDIISNYSGYLLVSSGDFNELSKAIGAIYTNAFGILLCLLAIVFTVRLFMHYKKSPLDEVEL